MQKYIIAILICPHKCAFTHLTVEKFYKPFTDIYVSKASLQTCYSNLCNVFSVIYGVRFVELTWYGLLRRIIWHSYKRCNVSFEMITFTLRFLVKWKRKFIWPHLNHCYAKDFNFILFIFSMRGDPYNIRMDLKEVGINTRNWVDSAQNRDYWRALVNAALNLRVPWT